MSDDAIPALAQAVVNAYLCAADEAAPGVVSGLYLTGSVALGDFQTHTSDVDFVAVTDRPLDGDGLARLERVHHRVAERIRRPQFDGIYVTWDELATGPRASGPHVHGGRLHRADGNARHAVTWQELHDHGVAVRGSEPGQLDIHTDPAELAAYTRRNLTTYWRRWHLRAQRWPWPGAVALSPWSAAWGVLGVTRLHYTLATGQITSKGEAGRYGLETFDTRWHPILTEALRIRRDDGEPQYHNAFQRRRDVLGFVGMVIADAEERWGLDRPSREDPEPGAPAVADEPSGS